MTQAKTTANRSHFVASDARATATTVEPMTRMLGFAGLLPQMLAAALCASGDPYGMGHMLAFGYSALVLSFVGGIWWGFAMRRESGQAELAALSVVPSLVGLLLLLAMAAFLPTGWALVAVGSAIIGSLLVDRWLEASGDAPPGWLRFRQPLSIALGVLTIVAGIFV